MIGEDEFGKKYYLSKNAKNNIKNDVKVSQPRGAESNTPSSLSADNNIITNSPENINPSQFGVRKPHSSYRNQNPGSNEVSDNIITETSTNFNPKNTTALNKFKQFVETQKYQGGNLDVQKCRVDNKFYTKTLNNENNDIERASRKFNEILDKIKKNPEILNNADEISKMEQELSQMHAPEDFANDMFNKFYNIVGGKKLDAFNTNLNNFYSKRGFKTYKKDKWNDEYMPSDWDKEYFGKYNNGEPDINYIALDELTVSPLDLQKIKEQLGHSINWSDETARNYKNPILEQIYGRYMERLSSSSPELAAANRNYANLRNFKKNEGVRRILRAGDNIDTASSALKNYKNTITKGNTHRNINDLEKVLTSEGYEPFLRQIDDINAAQDLQNSLPTGINFLGANNLLKGATALGLRGQRALNRRNIPAVYEQLMLSQHPELRIPLLYTADDVIFDSE